MAELIPFDDVHDEGLIFEINILKDTYETTRETLLTQVQDATFVDIVLGEYGITPDLSSQELIDRTCEWVSKPFSRSRTIRLRFLTVSFRIGYSNTISTSAPNYQISYKVKCIMDRTFCIFS
jgi:hypothetical protein